MPVRMRNMTLLLVLVIGTLIVGLVRAAPVAGQDEADTQAQIDSAMSAAPSTVSANATIQANEQDEAGKFVVLREGSNGWYCQPDEPGTPAPDPICFDQTWLDWMYAKAAGKEPNATVPGFAYMLQGGSEASNTDPSASEKTEDVDWMTSPPHIMVLLPGGLEQTALSSDFDAGGPWIMYEDTPYEHIMMAVAEGVMGEMGEMAEATPAA
jgi:hypothetical protein